MGVSLSKYQLKSIRKKARTRRGLKTPLLEPIFNKVVGWRLYQMRPQYRCLHVIEAATGGIL